MIDTTARSALPLLAPGQAQKEMFHNEALAMLDLLTCPAAVAAGLDTPPADPLPGQCWIVGDTPVAAWSGHAAALAGWTGGGWRFVSPFAGLTIWLGGDDGFVRYDGTQWASGVLTGACLRLGGDQVVGPRRAAIADPAGGSVEDTEARAAIAAILAGLRGHGLIAT